MGLLLEASNTPNSEWPPAGDVIVNPFVHHVALINLKSDTSRIKARHKEVTSQRPTTVKPHPSLQSAEGSTVVHRRYPTVAAVMSTSAADLPHLA